MLAVRYALQSEVKPVKKLLVWLLHRWKWLLWVLLVLVSLGIFLGFRHGDRRTIDTLTDQAAAQRWETEEKPYAEASVFLPEDNAISASSIPALRLSVENALTAAGVPSEDHPWLYAASRTQQETLQSDSGSVSATVDLTLIAGDYFRIHPMRLRTGWYMWESDVMHDRIVLDRQTAWDLFYTDDVVGQFLQWNGQRYQVAAVVDYPEGTYNARASKDVCRAWVFADSPGVSGGDTVPATDSDSAVTAPGADGADSADPGDASSGAAFSSGSAAFTCLEMVLPQPVKGFAAATLKSALKDLVPENTVYTDNSGRFSLSNRWNILRNLSTRGISEKAIGYPYYENAAQLAENQLALRLIPESIFLLFPIISLLIWLILLNRRRTWGLHGIGDAIAAAIDRRNARNYEARLEGRQPASRHQRRQERRAQRRSLQYEHRDTKRFFRK